MRELTVSEQEDINGGMDSWQAFWLGLGAGVVIGVLCC